MLFNSFVFVAFFGIVYSLYVLGRAHLKFQNLLLLAASYIFYGWWDWRFLSLILISSVIDYTLGHAIDRSDDERLRKRLLWGSVGVNLSLLGFFKYFNFFADSFIQLFGSLGLTLTPLELKIILPVGISFYTFQTMSYTIDIYRRELKPVDDFFDFALFVSFFPQLVAGPIERASKFLPQVIQKRQITAQGINEGVFLIIWGLFKKVVIADNMARLADPIFNQYAQHSGLDFVLAALAFTVQIYCDFSGYSDIARGLSKMMGFELMVNFRLPYFALNPSDFWLRWHISLSSWLRDYLYIALGGNRGGEWRTYRNLSLTMLLGGLWHGASWNFVLWGAYHGLILVLYRLFDKAPEHRNPWGGQYPYWRVVLKLIIMFNLTVIGWILFRCTSFDQIIHVFTNLGVAQSSGSTGLVKKLIFYASPLVLMQLGQYKSGDLLWAASWRPTLRGALYAALVLGILIFGVREASEFIYFQF